MKITKRQLRRIIKEAISDNVSLEILLDKGGTYTVDVPYYIIEDALEDGLGVDGLGFEIQTFIDAEYAPPGAYTRGFQPGGYEFSDSAKQEIQKMHQQWQQGGVWSDEKDYEAGFKR